jgi:hypothetical protein
MWNLYCGACAAGRKRRPELSGLAKNKAVRPNGGSCVVVHSAGLALEDAPLFVPSRVVENYTQLPIARADFAECDRRLDLRCE